MSGREQRGSALVVAVIIVVIVVGIGAAFLSESLFRSKQGFVEREQNEAQMAADAALDQLRRFMFVYRRNSLWSWNDILQYNTSIMLQELGVASLDPDDYANAEIWKQRSIDELKRAASGGAAYYARTTYGPREAPEPPTPGNVAPADYTQRVYFGRPTVYQNAAYVIIVRDNTDEQYPSTPPYTEGPGVQNLAVDGDAQVIAFITVTMMDGTQRQIEARIKFDPPVFTPEGAIVTGGTAKLTGNLTIVGVGAGANGADVIANGNIKAGTGSPRVDGKGKAVGTVEPAGEPNPVFEEGVQSGAPAVALPDANPASYENLAQYKFGADGAVYRRVGASWVFVQNASGSANAWYGWYYSAGSSRWESSTKDPNMPLSIYYVDSNLFMSGKSWINGTAIVKGNVELRGQGGVNTPQLIPSIGNVAVLSGGDIFANGTADIRGTIIAFEQIKLNGNFSLKGSAVAVDKQDVSTLVSTTDEYDDYFSGSASIEYSGLQQTFLNIEVFSCRLVYQRKTK